MNKFSNPNDTLRKADFSHMTPAAPFLKTLILQSILILTRVQINGGRMYCAYTVQMNSESNAVTIYNPPWWTVEMAALHGCTYIAIHYILIGTKDVSHLAHPLSKTL